MQNQAGVIFTISAPLGNKPGSRMDAANNIMRDLASEGLLLVKPNAVVRKNMNGGQQRKAAAPSQPPAPRPKMEEAFSEPPIGAGKPPQSNGTGKLCIVHNAKMRRREGDNGDVWFSHKHDGEWCKGKGTPSELNIVKARVSG
jgi:hypothetical protein